jgi:hypothetical protein
VDTADRVPSKLGDLPVSIDDIDAAIVHMFAERFRCAARGRDREDEILGARSRTRLGDGAPDAGRFVACNTRMTDVCRLAYIGYDRPGYRSGV